MLLPIIAFSMVQFMIVIQDSPNDKWLIRIINYIFHVSLGSTFFNVAELYKVRLLLHVFE